MRVEGVFHTTVQDPSNEVALHIRKLYIKKYNKEPKLLLFNAWGYDGVKIFESVLQKSDTPEGLIQAMHQTALNGASGPINFNENGTSPRMISVYQIKNNLSHFLK
jgi:ABC-type branched-subunit amino acid transport system substrate-binding protein